MKHLLFTLGALVLASTLTAQNALTLEQSVMQQYRQFAPDRISLFQWIPGTDEFTYMENYTVLKKGSAKSSTITTLVTLEEVNKAIKGKLRWFSGFQWKNDYEFYIQDGAKNYLFNVNTKDAKLVTALPDDAENANYNYQAGHVAYTRENNLYIQAADGEKIKVTDNADKQIVSGQAIARSEFGIKGGIFWSPKNNLLAFYQKDESEVHDYPLLDNENYPGTLKSIKYPMAGQASEKSRVGIFDPVKKKSYYIVPRGDAHDYLTNVSWTPDGQFLLIAEVNRGQNHMHLNLYEAATRKFVRTLLEEKSDKWVEPEHPAFFPSTKSNNFVWVSEKDGFANLYYYNLKGELIKQLTNNSFVCTGIVQANEKGTEIFFESTGPSPLNHWLYKVDLKGKQTLITKTPGTHRSVVSSSGNYVFDQFSSLTVQNIAQILKSDGKQVRQVLESEDKFADVQLGQTEMLTIKAVEGTKLYARMIKPHDFDSTKKYPVLVYVYGGPHAQLVTNSYLGGASLWMHWMANQGYLVFTVDNRGSANRGFAFESQIHRQLGTVEMEDQISGVDYLKSLSYVDSTRLAVHGWSFGGFMTTSLMLRNAGVFNVGVAGGPVTDWKYYEVMYGERYMDTPEENPEGYATASLLNHVENLQGDLLLIHGTIDDVVVMQHSFSLVQKFVEAGIQMDFFPYPMHLHNVRGKDRVHLMDKVLHYVIDHN